MKYVYLVKSGDDYKIGVATNLLARIKGLQTSNANRIELVTAKRTAKFAEYERHIHKLLYEWKTNGGTEWFNLPSERAIEISIIINQAPTYDEDDINILKVLVIESIEKQASVSNFMRNILEQFTAEKRIEKNITIKNFAQVSKEVDAQNKTQQKILAEQELIGLAMQVFSKSGRASTSLLQRKLRIGYARAARIVEALEDAGMIGPADGAYPRQVLKETLT